MLDEGDEYDEDTAMDDFDVAEITLGGGKK